MKTARWLICGAAVAILVLGFVDVHVLRSATIAGASAAYAVGLGLLMLLPVGWVLLSMRLTVWVRVTPGRALALAAMLVAPPLAFLVYQQSLPRSTGLG